MVKLFHSECNFTVFVLTFCELLRYNEARMIIKGGANYGIEV